MEDLFATSLGEGPVYADRHLVVTRTDNLVGLRFAGEIDINLSRLSFCDISGIRALIDAAAELGEGRRMLLHGLPEQLQTVMRVTGWADLPSLALCSCEGGTE